MTRITCFEKINDKINSRVHSELNFRGYGKVKWAWPVPAVDLYADRAIPQRRGEEFNDRMCSARMAHAGIRITVVKQRKMYSNVKHGRRHNFNVKRTSQSTRHKLTYGRDQTYCNVT